jgi:hypothetical protein
MWADFLTKSPSSTSTFQALQCLLDSCGFSCHQVAIAEGGVLNDRDD